MVQQGSQVPRAPTKRTKNQLPHITACEMVIMIDIHGIILPDVQITNKLYKSNRIKENKLDIYYCFTFQNAAIAVK